MLDIPKTSKITNNLKKNLQKDLRKHILRKDGNFFYVNRAVIRDIAIFFHNKKAHFINIIINDLGDKFELIYEFFIKFVKDNSKYCFIITEVDKKANEIDSIEIVYPSAFQIEKEIEKRYGLKFLLFTEEVSEQLFVIPTSLISTDYELNLLPIGVFNKIHQDNNYFLLQMDRYDNILSVSETTGWMYRGINELLKKKDLFTDNLKLTKRICLPSSYHHNIAYIMAVEKLAGIEISQKVNLMRTMLCELERYESSIIFFANLFFLLGYKRTYYDLLKKRNKLISLYQQHFNVRYLEDLNLIGSSIEIDKEELIYFEESTNDFLPEVFNSIYNFITKSYIKKKCQEVGILRKEDALDAGVTGHCLRGSGIEYDVRYESPYLSYLDRELSISWEVAISTGCDVFARSEVKLFDMQSSWKIIHHIVKRLIKDDSQIKPIDSSKIKIPGNEIAISQVESPTGGELLYYLRSSEFPGKNILGGAYICTPSLKNFLALKKYILKNNSLKLFSLIVHSMDLNFNEIDL